MGNGQVDAVRLAAIISPLRRTLLTAARSAQKLPEIPDSQVEIVRSLPRGTTSGPGELAERLGLSRSAVSNLLGAMEERDLIVRRPREEDRRQVDVIATERALSLFERFDRASAALVAGAAARLSPEDQAALAAAVPALERLRDALVDEYDQNVAGPRNTATASTLLTKESRN
ncbi:MarR family transcriptional regulator [Microbacterium sp. cf046]|uniref:MarR family transcriptional regulator n=1 Tax=Microbacterium sp. cf046 TaxID=1761803 RepID=UPI001587EA58|nr:MarR family transcriptional regulator [Microbacterium sp. cf046]